MNIVSRTITGIITIIIGIILIFIGFDVHFVLFYGIPIFIVGVFILFNKREDVIEKIKVRKK